MELPSVIISKRGEFSRNNQVTCNLLLLSSESGGFLTLLMAEVFRAGTVYPPSSVLKFLFTQMLSDSSLVRLDLDTVCVSLFLRYNLYLV